MRKQILALCALILSATLMQAAPAFAARRHCYTPAEMESELLLRLHSELMVITVTCTQGSHGENLVPLYTGFTRANMPMLHGAEQTMISFYKEYYGGDGVEWLDKLRTRLGNDYGQQIATMSAPAFCAKYRDMVVTLASAAPDDVRQTARDMLHNAGGEPEFGTCP